MSNAPLLTAIASALLHSLWAVSILGLGAACSLMLMRRAAPWQRHFIGLAWMLAMVAAPVLICVLTRIDSRQPWQTSLGAGTVAVPSWTDWLMPAISCLWLAGVILMLALRWGGWRFLRHLDRAGVSALPAEWAPRLAELRAALGIARQVTVRTGTWIATPFTAYVLRPVIWLPAHLLDRLPTDQLTALLAHELAHVRRLDWVWNLAQHGVESLLFYHPAMWWLSRRVRQERELACDALAAQVCGDPLVLAQALANAAAAPRMLPRLRPASLALAAHGGALHERIARLLQGHDARTAPQHGRAAILLVIAVGLSCVLAAALRMPDALMVNMQVRESMAGALTAGHYREISASYLFNAQRDYRVRIDARGRRLEVYREDGVVKPVDAQVRAWLAAMSAMHTRAR